jgi:nucleoid-associated protein YgaU
VERGCTLWNIAHFAYGNMESLEYLVVLMVLNVNGMVN